MDSFFGSIGIGNFIIVLCGLIFVHEMGHYLVAKLCGVRVETFSIGFGKELFGWNDGSGTRWKVSLIPLGGYVKMFGESSAPGEESGLDKNLNTTEINQSFAHKPLAQRAAVVAAGPAANFLFAILAFAAMYFFVGKPAVPDFMETGISSVAPGSAAEEAGFKVGDIIFRVDDTEITQFGDLVDVVKTSEGKSLSFHISRNGLTKNLVASPRKQETTISDTQTKVRFLLGVGAPVMQFNELGASESIWTGVTETWRMSVLTLKSVGDMFTGDAGVENMGGPIKIAQMSSEVGEMGGLAVLGFMAILSINLGLLNLFPIPMLDGGHLVFYFFEAILRRPLSPKIQEYCLRFGLALLLLLMVFVSVNDVIGLVKEYL